MNKYVCSKSDCTVSVTGKCLLSHVPVEKCPHVLISEAGEMEKQPKPPESAFPTRLVYPGNELGLQKISELFALRYGHLIGVLGAYDTGKTCLLCSLYLLASCGDFRPTRLFAGSMTLPGFESRLRRLRKWDKAGLPDKIVDHTSLSDPRQPGFMHLALKQSTPAKMLHDLFFTDLPGEWTTDLIKRADVAERLRFLTRADGLVITLLAPQLLEPTTRNSEVQSARMLLQRLRDAVRVPLNIPVIFAITRCDITGSVVPPAIYQVVEFARELGFRNASHMPVASFSDRADVPSGMGLGSLIDALLPSEVEAYRESRISPEGSRMFSRFRFVPEA